MTPHLHAEAFCLMRYEADDGSEDEIIWNSRDGVTPFVITLRSGKTARHVDWQNDRYAPDHIPQPGDRIFVDLTPDRALESTRRMVERWWDDPDMPMKDHPHLGPMGREGAARHLALGQLETPGSEPGQETSGQPDLVEVAAEGGS